MLGLGRGERSRSCLAGLGHTPEMVPRGLRGHPHTQQPLTVGLWYKSQSVEAAQQSSSFSLNSFLRIDILNDRLLFQTAWCRCLFRIPLFTQ